MQFSVRTQLSNTEVAGNPGAPIPLIPTNKIRSIQHRAVFYQDMGRCQIGKFSRAGELHARYMPAYCRSLTIQASEIQPWNVACLSS